MCRSEKCKIMRLVCRYSHLIPKVLSQLGKRNLEGLKAWDPCSKFVFEIEHP